MAKRAKRMEITYIDPVTCGKVCGSIAAVVAFFLALVFGISFSMMPFIGGLGLSMIIVAPVLWGITVFILGIIFAVIYNLIAEKIGGWKIGYK